MGAFTVFNGPQANGPSAKDMVSLIEAYNTLSSLLHDHVNKTAPTDTTLHGIVAYVNDVKSQLESIIGAKATIDTVNTLRNIVDEKATSTALTNAINTLNSAISNKADNSVVDTKVDKIDFNNLSGEVSALNTKVDVLNNEWNKYKSHVTDTDTQLAFDCAIKSATYFIGQLKVLTTIDFTKWAHFTAPFAGTGALIDTETNGAYILGCLSTDWSDDNNVPSDEYANKACRAYIKYVNTNPFDAICDITVTKIGDDYTGAITAVVSKKANTWEDLAFHIIVGTNSTGKPLAYLAVSSKGLAISQSQYSNTNFRVCGENFLPVGVEGYSTPTGLTHAVATAFIGTTPASLFSATHVKANSIISNKYTDEEDTALLNIEKSIDPNTDVEIKQLIIGNSSFDHLLFAKRPSMVVETEDGTRILTAFITTRDIADNLLPIGAIIRWAPVDDLGNLKNIPSGFIACDGTKISTIDYPELCQLLGIDENGMATLPLEDHSIIKAVVTTLTISDSSDISSDSILEFGSLNKKIEEEKLRAQTAEAGLQSRVNEVNTDLEAEITRSTDKDTELELAIDAEVQRAEGVEQTLRTDLDIVVNNSESYGNRITAAEQSITDAQQAVTAEQQRAEAAEQALGDRITAAETANDAKVAELTQDVADETARASQAERDLSSRIDQLHPNS